MRRSTKNKFVKAIWFYFKRALNLCLVVSFFLIERVIRSDWKMYLVESHKRNSNSPLCLQNT